MARLLAALLLSGCAAFSVTEADCRSANWRERGYDDGFGGHPAQDLRLAQECGRHGVAFPQAAYLEGWREGHGEHDRLKTMQDI